ncbi:MAG: hypothetical protein ACYC46_02045 [Acidobacteriaceae bacterium]
MPKPHAVTPARLTILVSLLLLAAVAPAPAIAKKIPDSAWQTGTLLKVTDDSSSRIMGWTSHNGVGHVGTYVRVVWHYTIEDGQYIYEAERTTKQRDKPLDVTVNAPVKFAVVKMDLYLRDDEGKVHKLGIETKTLKTESGSSK